MHDVFLLTDPRQRRRKHQDWIWTAWILHSALFSPESYPFHKVLFQSYRFLACSPVIGIAQCYLPVLRIFVGCHGVSAIWSFVEGSRTYSSPLPRDSYISPFHQIHTVSAVINTHICYSCRFPVYLLAITLWLRDESRRYRWRLGMHGCRNVSHLVLEFECCKENNEHDKFECRWYLRVRTFPFVSDLASAVHYSFLALSSQYHHQCKFTPFTLRSCESTGSSLRSIAVATLRVPLPHLTIYTISLQNLPFYLRRRPLRNR